MAIRPSCPMREDVSGIHQRPAGRNEAAQKQNTVSTRICQFLSFFGLFLPSQARRQPCKKSLNKCVPFLVMRRHLSVKSFLHHASPSTALSSSAWSSWSVGVGCLSTCRSPRAGRGAGLEAVLEPPGQAAQGPHAASASRLSPLRLLAPVVLPDLGRGETAAGALLLLDVHGPATATTAQSVRLVVALAETRSTLGHFF